MNAERLPTTTSSNACIDAKVILLLRKSMITSAKDSLQRSLVSDEKQEIKRHKEGNKSTAFLDLDAKEESGRL
ncbi:hypothetical protein BDV09DRAFT_159536 [Aspergillus tetrazonus]